MNTKFKELEKFLRKIAQARQRKIDNCQLECKAQGLLR